MWLCMDNGCVVWATDYTWLKRQLDLMVEGYHIDGAKQPVNVARK